jgi:hypothetical protein
VTHTGRVGTAEEIATRQREATARALREAAAIYYDRRKTLLAGGSEAALAEAVYEDTPLRALGVGLAQFQAHLHVGQEPAGAAGARVRAGGSGGGQGPRLFDLAAPIPSEWSAGNPIGTGRLSDLGLEIISTTPEGVPRLAPNRAVSSSSSKDYEFLAQQFGAPVADGLLAAAALGYRGEVGILAIGRFLQDHAGGVPLQLNHLQSITCALFGVDLSAYSDRGIHDVEHLAGHPSTGNRTGGIYATTRAGEDLVISIGSRETSKLELSERLAGIIRTGGAFSADSVVRQSLDREAFDYRLDQLEAMVNGRPVPPWKSTRSPEFLDVWARLFAVSVSLAMVPTVSFAGLRKRDANRAKLAQRGPVNEIDFAVVYPEVHASLLQELRAMRSRFPQGTERPASPEPFAQSARFKRIHGALFPARAPDDLRQSLLRVLEKRAFGATNGGSPSKAQGAAQRDAILDLNARSIALDPEFFMVGGNLRQGLALEAFEDWLTRRAGAGDPLPQPGDVAGIMSALRALDDPLRGMRELLASSGRTSSGRTR